MLSLLYSAMCMLPRAFYYYIVTGNGAWRFMVLPPRLYIYYLVLYRAAYYIVVQCLVCACCHGYRYI